MSSWVRATTHNPNQAFFSPFHARGSIAPAQTLLPHPSNQGGRGWLGLCLGARRWHHSARDRVARGSTQSEEVETRGQAAETGNMFAPCWVPAFISSGTGMAAGPATSRFEGGWEPASALIFLNQWGAHSVCPPRVRRLNPFWRLAWACHFSPPPLSAWRWAPKILSPGVQTFPQTVAATAFLSCLQAHLTRFSPLLPYIGLISSLVYGDRTGFRFCSFPLAATPSHLPSDPYWEHQVLSFCVPLEHSFTVSKEFCSLKHV